MPFSYLNPNFLKLVPRCPYFLTKVHCTTHNKKIKLPSSLFNQKIYYTRDYTPTTFADVTLDRL